MHIFTHKRTLHTLRRFRSRRRRVYRALRQSQRPNNTYIALSYLRTSSAFIPFGNDILEKRIKDKLGQVKVKKRDTRSLAAVKTK